MDLVPVDLADAYETNAEDWPATAVIRFRDLLLTRHRDIVTVIACDSNAGIGDRPADVLRQSARDTGYAAAKVPLMEVLAAGAAPIIVVNALGMSLDGPGSDVLAGIRECVALSGHTPVITGSDETNIPTVQSSVGVTVIGIAAPQQLLLGQARAGDNVLLVGRPMDGLTLSYEESDPQLVTPRGVTLLTSLDAVHEVLPVGSHGVRYEARELARTARLHFHERDSQADMDASAGSSTCVLVACRPGTGAEIQRLLQQDVTHVGDLLSPLT